ncbi:hypothetical protein H0H87_001434 [Tephrocybe sp. NHM501043]|nr:hypothetical protein H0H87_001434 [Tephrocybe sp. NHM501043]
MATTALLSPTQRRTPSPTLSNPQILSAQSTISSSAVSFQTAPLSASTSMQTITSPVTNSYHRTSQEIRIVTVTEEIVRLEKRPVAAQDSYVPRVMAGPLPPSPPASDIDDESIIYTEPESLSTPPEPEPELPPPSPPPPRLHRSSTDTKASSLRTVITGPPPPPPSAYLPSPPQTSFTQSATQLSSDAYLHPPPSNITRERPTRRNTTGSAPKQPFPRPITLEDFKAKHKFSFDVIGNELTPSAKYDFKFKDYAPWVFRSLREDYFHLDPADYLLSLTSKYILSELGSPGKSGSFFYFSRDYRFIIKTIHHAEHAYLLRILPAYYEHVRANPHTLLSRFYGLHRVKLPRGRKIHFVIMNNIFPPHRDIHETYDLKGSTIGREYPEEKARQNPRAVLKDLNWINRGRMLELGPEKRALLAEQLRRDSAFLKQVNVMDYSLLVGIHNMQRGNRDNVRRNTLKVFSPPIPQTPHRKKTMGHSRTLSGHNSQGSPEAIAMRRALYRTSGHVDAVQLPDAADEPSSAQAQDPSTSDGASSNAQHASSSSSHPNSLQLRAGTSSSSSHQPTVSTSGYQTHPNRRDRDSHRDKGKDRGKGLADHFVDRQHFVFYQDEGGLRATNEGNEDMDIIYYVGVIDILTPYGGLKKLESFWKGLKADRHKISPVPPTEYADRFLSFMKAIMRGGEGGARFKAE